MIYTPSQEQQLLKNSLERFLAETYPFQVHLKAIVSEEGRSRDLWRGLAELGVLGAAFDENVGGLGGNAYDTALIMEALGRGLCAEPYLSTVVLAGGLLRHGGSPTQKANHLPAIVRGEAIYAVAFAEQQSRYNLANVQMTARRQGSGFLLNGRKAVVYGAPWADGYFVSARTRGEPCGKSGISVFYVPRDSRGVSLQSYRTVDGFRAAEIILDDVAVPADATIGPPDEALPLIEHVADEAIAALCAEAVGAMRALDEKTIAYCKTRVAFGQPLSKFQVIQHRLVDMRVAVEQSASTALMAASKLDAPASVRARTTSAAKAQIGRDSRFIGQNAIQLHGAIGMTDELDIGHYFKRLTMIDLLFGNAAYHVRRFAGLTWPKDIPK